MMSTPDIDREQQIADEALEAWKDASFRYLDARYPELPWNDADENSGKELQQGEEHAGGAEGLSPPLTVLAAGACTHDSEAGRAAASPLSQSARPRRG